ncbi:hypothetical protein QN277_023521 [Acacia crassicarpa]|uniref:Uncharacterized protein n=1 Tax=Acacia crassicarpa TaxID=499986 RepID=A0AAE1MRQ2_9FABA|nr:hypothetical protein QN277_023521 [Acacia crassicarpa]
MASSICRNLISFIGLGNRPSTASSFSCGNEVPPVGAVLVRAPRGRNLPGSLSVVSALEPSNSSGISSDSNYVVPTEKSFPLSDPSNITRPLAEILSDLNKKVPDNIVEADVHGTPLIRWYHANRMLNFYAPGWCGESYVRSSKDGTVTVLYWITVRGSDGEVIRGSTGTVYPSDGIKDPVAAATELAFCKACARLGLGLYLYYEAQP